MSHREALKSRIRACSNCSHHVKLKSFWRNHIANTLDTVVAFTDSFADSFTDVYTEPERHSHLGCPAQIFGRLLDLSKFETIPIFSPSWLHPRSRWTGPSSGRMLSSSEP